MKLIVLGLGNPGQQFTNTRHNVGHSFIDYFSNLNDSVFEKKTHFLISQCLHFQTKIILLKSTSYMNHNGHGLSNFLRKWLLPQDIFLVIHDELNLALNKIKLSSGKGAGGHKGVLSIIQELGFSPLRMRVGINTAQSSQTNVSDYVLANFSASEKDSINNLYPKVVHAIHLLCDRGLSAATNYINRYPIPTPPQL